MREQKKVIISANLQEKQYLLGDLSINILARVTSKCGIITMFSSIRRDTKSEYFGELSSLR